MSLFMIDQRQLLDSETACVSHRNNVLAANRDQMRAVRSVGTKNSGLPKPWATRGTLVRTIYDRYSVVDPRKVHDIR